MSSSEYCSNRLVDTATPTTPAETDIFVKDDDEESYVPDEHVTTAAARVDDSKKIDDRKARAMLEQLLKSASAYISFLDVSRNSDVREQPKCLSGGTLKDYQLRGFSWMVGLHFNGFSGILADEMGLGKTIQTLAFLAHLKEANFLKKGGRLVVVPLSTLHNWKAEALKWCPDLEVLIYYGSKEDRKDLCDDLIARGEANAVAGKKERVDLPVVFTTYETLMRDVAMLRKISWNVCVVDEGHRLKNAACQLAERLGRVLCDEVTSKEAFEIEERRFYRAALKKHRRDKRAARAETEACRGEIKAAAEKNRKLRNNGLHVTKIMLTGTPLQNTLDELWSLLHFLLPAIFDDLSSFKQVFRMSSENLSTLDESDERRVVDKLHHILKPFMLRRLKCHVEKSLPAKKEVLIFTDLTHAQKSLYESCVERTLQSQLRESTGTTLSMRNVFMRLRQLALHPYLVTPGDDSYPLDEELRSLSGKMMALDTILTAAYAANRKVLVFSQFTSMLDIVEDYLEKLRPDWKFGRIDGSVSADDRQSQMQIFNSCPIEEGSVFLLSTRAGGVGVNLAGADTVVFFDSDWNPQNDSQAQDRSHRIGQTSEVLVLRMVSAGTVEERMLRVADDKRKLERVISSGFTNQKRRKISSKEEVEALLRSELVSLGGHGGRGIDHKLLRNLVGDKRSQLFAGDIPAIGKGYEIVEHSASSIVGDV